MFSREEFSIEPFSSRSQILPISREMRSFSAPPSASTDFLPIDKGLRRLPLPQLPLYQGEIITFRTHDTTPGDERPFAADLSGSNPCDQEDPALHVFGSCCDGDRLSSWQSTTFSVATPHCNKHLPSFRQFCLGANVPLRLRPPTPDMNQGGHSDIQTLSTAASIGSTLLDSRSPIQGALLASIITESCPQLRASLAQEVKLRLEHLTDLEKDDTRARYVLQDCGKPYWTTLHMHHEYRGNAVLSGTVNDGQSTYSAYSSRDRMIAVYYWALHHTHKSYADIAYELFLPLGALSNWILQICKQ
jgi:hypothetical protein